MAFALTSRLRKFVLTAHITFSVGWLGAVASFLVLSISGLTSQNPEVVRGCYIAMNLVGQFVIVPMSLASLATGLIQSLGTEWGLFRHYWILTKFFLSILATIALLLHQITAVAEAANRVSGAAAAAIPSSELRSVGIQLVGDASLGLIVLIVATTLSVYKPWGLTPYGRRQQRERRFESPKSQEMSRKMPTANPASNSLEIGNEPTSDGLGLSVKITLAVIGIIVLAFVVWHLAGGGLGHLGH